MPLNRVEDTPRHFEDRPLCLTFAMQDGEGRRVACSATLTCLEDLDRTSGGQAAHLASFEKHRGEIEREASRLYDEQRSPVIVETVRS